MKLEEILLDDRVVYSISSNLYYLMDIIPEIRHMIGFFHKHSDHHLDVWNHTLLALSLSEKDLDVRLALLLHDIGKPFCFKEGETRHYENHQLVSEKMSRDILKRLGYDDSYIEKICYLVKNHDSPITTKQIEDNYELTKTLYKVQYCDMLAHHPDKLEKRKKYLEKTKEKILSTSK